MRPYNELKEAIEQGGSVLIDGQVITTVDALPSKAELAKGTDDESKVVAEYEAKIKALQAEVATLKKADTSAADKAAADKAAAEKAAAAEKKAADKAAADKAAAENKTEGEGQK